MATSVINEIKTVSETIMSTDTAADSAGKFEFTDIPIYKFNQLVLIGYKGTDTGDSRFAVIIPMVVMGNGDTKIPVAVGTENGVLTFSLSSTQLNLMFRMISDYNTLHIKKIIGTF